MTDDYPFTLEHFQAAAKSVIDGRMDATGFNFRDFVKLPNLRGAIEKRRGELLADAFALLILGFGDCVELHEGDREAGCESCKTMLLCDRIWKELRG